MPSKQSNSPTKIAATGNKMSLSSSSLGTSSKTKATATALTKAKSKPKTKKVAQSSLDNKLELAPKSIDDIWRQQQNALDLKAFLPQKKALELCLIFTRMLREKRFGPALGVAEQILEIEPDNRLINEHIEMLRELGEHSSDDESESECEREENDDGGSKSSTREPGTANDNVVQSEEESSDSEEERGVLTHHLKKKKSSSVRRIE